MREHRVRNALLMAAFLVGTCLWVVPDLRDRYPHSAAATLTLLLVLLIADIVGSYQLGQWARDKNSSLEATAPSTRPVPPWLAGLIAAVPAVGIVAAQVIGGTGQAASDTLGLFAIYGLGMLLGATLGLTSRA